MIDKDTNAINKNIMEENSRNVIIAKMYPVIRKIQVVKEKEA